ncbi:MAG: hypothetical protein K9M11_03460 [Candidatus Pacebacteria bacterium]|nr:hypothetical protein [Candidatus Paceibacterota bacterium]
MNILSVLFLFAWYPCLWITFYIVALLAGGEDELEHDAMTTRAIISQNIGSFLLGYHMLWRLSIAGLYLIGLILEFWIDPFVVSLSIVFTVLFIFISFDYGQICEDEDMPCAI